MAKQIARNGRPGSNLVQAMALLVNNQAALVSQHASLLNEMAEARKEFAEIRRELELIKAALARRWSILERLPETIREKIGAQK